MHLSIATTAAMGNMCGVIDSNGLPRGVAHSRSKKAQLLTIQRTRQPLETAILTEGMHLSIATTAAMGNMCGLFDSNGLPRGVAHSRSKKAQLLFIQRTRQPLENPILTEGLHLSIAATAAMGNMCGVIDSNGLPRAVAHSRSKKAQLLTIQRTRQPLETAILTEGMHLSIATTAAMGNMCGLFDSNGLPRGVAHSRSKKAQ